MSPTVISVLNQNFCSNQNFLHNFVLRSQGIFHFHFSFEKYTIFQYNSLHIFPRYMSRILMRVITSLISWNYASLTIKFIARNLFTRLTNAVSSSTDCFRRIFLNSLVLRSAGIFLRLRRRFSSHWRNNFCSLCIIFCYNSLRLCCERTSVFPDLISIIQENVTTACYILTKEFIALF